MANLELYSHTPRLFYMGYGLPFGMVSMTVSTGPAICFRSNVFKVSISRSFVLCLFQKACMVAPTVTVIVRLMCWPSALFYAGRRLSFAHFGV